MACRVLPSGRAWRALSGCRFLDVLRGNVMTHGELQRSVLPNGLRVLGVEEDLGRELVKSLSAEHRKVAIYADKAHPISSPPLARPDRKDRP